MRIFIFLALMIIPLQLFAAEPKNMTTGRFQVMQLSNMRRDQILIDTQTGRTWHLLCLVPSPSVANDCEKSAWIADEVEGITKTQKEIMKEAYELESFIKSQKSPAPNSQ